MNVDQILQLDYREKKNREIIQKALKRIKPLSKYQGGKIPFEMLEKLVMVICKKYNMYIRVLEPDLWSNGDNFIWRVVIVDGKTLRDINVVFGLSLYEVFAKTGIAMYGAREKAGGKT